LALRAMIFPEGLLRALGAIKHRTLLRGNVARSRWINYVGASHLLALLPELVPLNRLQVASLDGVAPPANDLGHRKEYRCVNPGRELIKPILFTAAMAARNSHSSLRRFYEHLTAQGKKKMVALVALMRKIIIIANARLKSFYASQQAPKIV